MPLVINEEQKMLKTSAKEFLKERSPVEALRKLRDTKDENGYDTQMWKEMAEMGWASLNIPEEYGGLNFGHTGLGQILEEMGRTLAASPMMSTVVLGATAVNLAGNVVQKEAILPAVAEGTMLLSLALEEGRQHNPKKTAMTATVNGDEYVLNGQKVFVLDGHVANKFVVVARTAGNAGDKEGISLFLVDANTEGVTVERKVMMDSRNAATVNFDNVIVPASALMGEEGKAYAVLTKTLDIARICLASEMLGSIQEAFDRTVTYLKEREQFGVPIGSFQGLQHRAATMYSEIELCKSLVLKALQAVDADSQALPIVASMTKSKIGEVAKLVSNEGVQMFGGIGMTDDEEIGFFLKRARVAQQTLGDSNYHLNRFAKINGF